MTDLDPTIIANKLERMVERLDRLKAYEEYPLEQYLADDNTQIIVERLLELLIQSALDINKSLLKRVAGKSVEKNFDSFIEMGACGFIPSNLAQKLAPSGPFRNVLSHQYDDIIPEQVFANFREALDQYPQYIEAIQDYLDSL